MKTIISILLSARVSDCYTNRLRWLLLVVQEFLLLLLLLLECRCKYDLDLFPLMKLTPCN